MSNPKTDTSNLPNIEFRGREVASALQPYAAKLERVCGEAYYDVSTVDGNARNCGPVLLVQVADDEDELRTMAQEPESLLGFVSDCDRRDQYAATLETALQLLAKDASEAAAGGAKDGVFSQATGPLSYGESGGLSYRGHATLVEHGGQVYLVAVTFGADVAPEAIAWACESIVGGAIRHGVLVDSAV